MDELPVQYFNRILFFDREVARHHGHLMARARKNGFSPTAMDTLIAASAFANGMAVATLNRTEFEQLGVESVEF